MSEQREHWTSQVGFLLAAIGSAVGLGLLWKFPYTVGQNGGGLFLLSYVLCIIVIGIPVLIGELLLGRHTQSAAVNAFGKLSSNQPFWKMGGWLGVISSFLIMSFYSVIAGFGMSYVLMSLTNFYSSVPLEQIPKVFTLLSHSGGIVIFWHFLFTLITMSIVLSGVRKGIEFWAKIMTRTLFVILIAFCLYGLTLSGFSDTVKFIFNWDVQSFDFSSILEALGLAFFTLSLGQGIMISYGSYMRKKENIPVMALVIAGAVIVVAVLVAFSIFPIIFTFNFVPEQGVGLIFETMPYLFAQLPGSILISTIFFLLFVFAALTSSIPFIEVPATNLMELKGFSRKKAVLIVSGAVFLFGIPCALSFSQALFPNWSSVYGSSYLDTINALVSVWLIPVGGLITALFLGWRVPKKDLIEEFPTSSKWHKFFHLWYFFMRYIIPILILLIILQKTGLINFDTFLR
ncbi:sodium-dependent transporter [Candidatus Aerophobetes bacterium]|uniref:Transporter n=1 Tax=Aerophobetes bacterium TaxID=2030807 RepID=A0A2A4X670_UNCAE|nr:MAG: sodium-dependent transporter [Candidatus Aerophobetes bacterium]